MTDNDDHRWQPTAAELHKILKPNLVHGGLYPTSRPGSYLLTFSPNKNTPIGEEIGMEGEMYSKMLVVWLETVATSTAYTLTWDEFLCEEGINPGSDPLHVHLISTWRVRKYGDLLRLAIRPRIGKLTQAGLDLFEAIEPKD